MTTEAILWNGAFARADLAPREMGRDSSTQQDPARVALDAAMDRYARGDDAAFAELYAGLAGRVRAFLLRLGGDPARAADLTQESFLRLHRARGSFAPGGAVVPWALAIARNVHLDHLRRRARGDAPAPLAEDDDESPGARLPATDGDGEQLVLAREVMAIVRATLDALPLRQREAFVLLRFEGLSVAEAAAVLGATETAVKLRAFRAYEALRAALQKREGTT